ncbi:hypothetical protein Tco_1516103 [Tanacetum coccineum]
MHTRSSSNLIAESSTTPKRRNRRRSKQRVEPFSLEETPVDTMADQRTMAELLQAPTEGYGDAIVIPAILAENFELKHGLLNLRRIYHNHDIFYDGDDDEELFLDEVKRIQQILERTSFDAITPDFPITDSLSMGDEHLSTIPETESGELIKSSVENLVPTPSESEDLSKDLSDIESECNMPICDDFTTVSNPLFDADNDFSSSDDKSFSDFKIFSNPLSDEEIISTKIDPHHFNAESDLIESLLNRDTLIISSPKFDSLLEKLLYDNSSPRPPKESNSEIFNATIEVFSPSPIPIEDSDSLMEEIDLFLNPDDSIPPGIENDDYDSERDILFLQELLSNDSLSLPETESFHFDHYDVPSSPRPPAKPPDDGVFFDFEPDTGVLTAKVVEDISEHYVLMPKLLPTQPTLCPDIDTLLLFFHSENEDKVFNLDCRRYDALVLFGFVLRSLELIP